METDVKSLESAITKLEKLVPGQINRFKHLSGAFNKKLDKELPRHGIWVPYELIQRNPELENLDKASINAGSKVIDSLWHLDKLVRSLFGKISNDRLTAYLKIRVRLWMSYIRLDLSSENLSDYNSALKDLAKYSTKKEFESQLKILIMLVEEIVNSPNADAEDKWKICGYTAEVLREHNFKLNTAKRFAVLSNKFSKEV